MTIELVPFDPAAHDAQHVATLIYQADPEFNALVFGDEEEGIQTIVKLMSMETNYFSPEYLRCAVCEGEVVGVVIDVPVKDKAALDAASGTLYPRAMGVWAFLRHMPLYMRIERIMNQQLDEDGGYILFICVAPGYRGRGYGARMLEMVDAAYPKLYLHVNMRNARAVRFYQRCGFRIASEGATKLRGEERGLYLMEKG